MWKLVERTKESDSKAEEAETCRDDSDSMILGFLPRARPIWPSRMRAFVPAQQTLESTAASLGYSQSPLRPTSYRAVQGDLRSVPHCSRSRSGLTQDAGGAQPVERSKWVKVGSKDWKQQRVSVGRREQPPVDLEQAGRGYTSALDNDSIRLTSRTRVHTIRHHCKRPLHFQSPYLCSNLLADRCDK